MNGLFFRDMTSEEIAVIDRLLSSISSDKDDIISAIRRCPVRTIDNNGSLEFDSGSPVGVSLIKMGVLTEGEFYDIDGTLAHVLLHVSNGVIKELEYYKEDGSKVIKMPVPSDVSVADQGLP